MLTAKLLSEKKTFGASLWQGNNKIPFRSCCAEMIFQASADVTRVKGIECKLRWNRAMHPYVSYDA